LPAAFVPRAFKAEILEEAVKRIFVICYLDVYVKQDGRWQMVAWQSSRVTP
jgi:hypothetical protein